MCDLCEIIPVLLGDFLELVIVDWFQKMIQKLIFIFFRQLSVTVAGFQLHRRQFFLNESTIMLKLKISD